MPGSPEYHEELLNLRELGRHHSPLRRPSGEASGPRLGKGAMDVASHSHTVHEEVLHLSTIEWAGGPERLLKVLKARTPSMGLRFGDAFDCNHHLYPMALLLSSLLVMAMLGRGRVIATVTTTEAGGGFGLVVEVGLGSLRTHCVLGGDVQKLPCCSWGLAHRAVGEGIDHIGDVRELIALCGEALNVLTVGLIGPLRAITQVPWVSSPSARTLEVLDENQVEVAPAADVPDSLALLVRR